MLSAGNNVCVYNSTVSEVDTYKYKALETGVVLFKRQHACEVDLHSYTYMPIDDNVLV